MRGSPLDPNRDDELSQALENVRHALDQANRGRALFEYAYGDFAHAEPGALCPNDELGREEVALD
jgi:hypothetical protein